MWPCNLDLWPSDLWTITVPSLVILFSAVSVLSYGQTDRMNHTQTPLIALLTRLSSASVTISKDQYVLQFHERMSLRGNSATDDTWQYKVNSYHCSLSMMARSRACWLNNKNKSHKHSSLRCTTCANKLLRQPTARNQTPNVHWRLTTTSACRHAT